MVNAFNVFLQGAELCGTIVAELTCIGSFTRMTTHVDPVRKQQKSIELLKIVSYKCAVLLDASAISPRNSRVFF